MARDYAGKVERLSDAAAAHRRLWVFCRFCGHASRQDPFELARKIGSDMALDQAAVKLRCGRCTHKHAAILLAAISEPVR